MLGLDFGILFTLGVQIEGLPLSKAGFRIEATSQTEALLKRYQSLYKFTDQLGYIFVSDLVGNFQETQTGGRRKIELQVINEEYFNSFMIHLTDNSLLQDINLDYDPEALPALRGLPDSFKRLFYIDLDALQGVNPIDTDQLLGLAPPILKFLRGQVEYITQQSTGRSLQPTEADDFYVQYDLNQVPKGLYRLKEMGSASNEQLIYIDPALYQNPPFALAEITIPAGNVTLQEYRIQFKKRT